MLVTYTRGDSNSRTVVVNNRDSADRIAELLISGATIKVYTAKSYSNKEYIIPITDGYIDTTRGDEFYC